MFHISRKPLSRRALLRGAGAAALALPWLEAMDPPRRAGRSSMPKRLVLMFSPAGTVHGQWAPGRIGDAWRLSPILAPLREHQSDLVVIDGLEMKRGRIGDGHQQGMAHLWTNAELLPGDTRGGDPDALPCGFASGPSIDQAIAKRLGLTSMPACALAVQAGESRDAWSRMTYAGANAPVDPVNDPWQAFKDLFGSVARDGDGRAALEALRARRKTVADAVLASYGSLRAKLGAADRQRLEAHVEYVHDLQQQAARVTSRDACAYAKLDEGAIDVHANESFPIVGKLQMDVIAAALACDIARVATLQWSQALADVTFTWLGISGDFMGHHSLSHRNEPDARVLLTKINTWYAEQLAYLIGRLKSVRESDGTTVFDKTLVVWGNELAEGSAHTASPAPFVLAGKCGGAIRTNRFLSCEGRPHGDLLVSIANAMGVEMTSFGNREWCSGPIADLS